MNYELSQEVLAGLYIASLLMGAFAGLVYEIFKLRRNIIRLPSIAEVIIISVEDILFFTAWGAAFSVLLYITTHGVVRIEAILAQLAGFIIYRATLGRVITWLIERISVFVRKHIVARIKRLLKTASIFHFPSKKRTRANKGD